MTAEQIREVAWYFFITGCARSGRDIRRERKKIEEEFERDLALYDTLNLVDSSFFSKVMEKM